MAKSRDTSRRVRNIINTNHYQSLFDTRVMPGQSNVDLWGVTTAQLIAQNDPEGSGGSFQAVSVGTAFQGFGMDHGHIDDYMGGREEAESPRIRDKHWAWYSSDFMSRMQAGCTRILTVTPWHVDDLAGRILRTEGDDWKVIRLPEMIRPGMEPPCEWDPRKEGEFLWPSFFWNPEAEPEGISYEEMVARNAHHFEATQRRDPYDHQAKWMVNPTSKEGLLFDEDDFQWYTQDPRALLHTFDDMIISIDCSFKDKPTSDRISVSIWGKRGPNLYLLDEQVFRVSFPRLVQRVMALKSQYPRAAVLIEAKANGDALIQMLRNAVPDIIGFEPGNTPKKARAQVAANRTKAGQVFLPHPNYLPTIMDWKDEVVHFGERPYDDRVDSFSQVCIHWQGTSVDLKAGWSRLFNLFGM